MSETSRPNVCDECRKAMPDIDWNVPCIHATHDREAWFAWKFGPVGWLRRPIPQWTFCEWRWSLLASVRWLALGKFAVRMPT